MKMESFRVNENCNRFCKQLMLVLYIERRDTSDK